MQTHRLNTLNRLSTNEMEDLAASHRSVHSKPSRLNGENIAGAAFLFFSSLFMAAGMVNPVFAVVYPVDFMLVAVGVALVTLGYRTYRNELRKATGGAPKSARY